MRGPLHSDESDVLKNPHLPRGSAIHKIPSPNIPPRPINGFRHLQFRLDQGGERWKRRLLELMKHLILWYRESCACSYNLGTEIFVGMLGRGKTWKEVGSTMENVIGA